jgi:ribosomal protein L12E/L44/L45/RPP1/RPP2
MKFAQQLWSGNIAAEYSHLDNPKFKKQLDEALERYIPYMVVFGEEEVSKNIVKIKNMKLKTEIEVPVAEMVPSLLRQGCATVDQVSDVDFLEAMRAVSSTVSVSAASASASETETETVTVTAVAETATITADSETKKEESEEK